MIEVVESPLLGVFEILVFAAGLTAITFIALIIFLDLHREQELMALPDKKR